MPGIKSILGLEFTVNLLIPSSFSCFLPTKFNILVFLPSEITYPRNLAIFLSSLSGNLIRPVLLDFNSDKIPLLFLSKGAIFNNLVK